MARQTFPAILEISLALGFLALGLAGVLSGRTLVREYLYFFAWYPFLLLLDGLLRWRQGESWLLERPRDFLQMGFLSVTVWLVFEACNLVLGNWRYAGIQPHWWLRWPGYALAFATVLPGILLTARVLAGWGAWRGTPGRSRSWTSWQPLFLLLGAVCLVLTLTRPGYAFPLVWGAFFFLLDPINDLWTGNSMTRRWLAGERREIYCLLAAGLICGIWWEMWNYPATARWVYALPILNFGKIFEMPVLGYLGFLPFALEGAVMYNFYQALEERVLTTPGRRRWSYLVQLAFWLIMFTAMDAWTVISYQ
jgi:hypothetical protein